MDFYSGMYIMQQTTKWDLQNCSITDLQPKDFHDIQILQQQTINIK